MNAVETLKAARDAGLTIDIVGEKLSVRGIGDRRAQLVESICVNKREIMSIIGGEPAKEASNEKEGKSNGGNVMPPELSLPEVMPQFELHERLDLVSQILGQGEPAISWCLARANAYFEKFSESTFEDQDAAAASDLVRWQNLNSDRLTGPNTSG